MCTFNGTAQIFSTSRVILLLNSSMKIEMLTHLKKESTLLIRIVMQVPSEVEAIPDPSFPFPLLQSFQRRTVCIVFLTFAIYI